MFTTSIPIKCKEDTPPPPKSLLSNHLIHTAPKSHIDSRVMRHSIYNSKSINKLTKEYPSKNPF